MTRKILSLFLLIPSIGISQTAERQPYVDLVNANTRFAFKLFHQSVMKAPDTNVLVSPTALSLDFALLQNGASLAARDQIISAFEFGNLSAEVINQQSLALRQALTYDPPKEHSDVRLRRGLQPPVVCCAPPPEHLTLAGSLWTQPTVGFRREFLEVNEKFYHYQSFSVPNKRTAASGTVNTWIARQTGGSLINALDSWRQDDFLLIDATSFKGAWVKPFAEKSTQPKDFNLPSRQKRQVPMMSQSGFYSYLRGPKFQAVRLPYFHAAMYVFLPDEDSSLKEFEQSLTSESWASWIHDISGHEGHLELPRFQSNFRGEITGLLSDMGMDRLFTSLSSFAPLVANPEGAKLTRVVQVISLKVDEKGTEVVSAGIVGGVIGGVSTAPRPEPFRMIVDRPFFFAICDNQTNAILYMGAINDPMPLLPGP